MKSKSLLLVFTALMLSACTEITVRPMPTTEKISHVLIRTNPKVAVDDFLEVLIEGFQRHGIGTKVINETDEVGDAYVVDYVAYRKWDLAPYVVDATINIQKNGNRIAHGEYHLKGGGGFALTKWEGTKTKINPVIDELLKDYPVR